MTETANKALVGNVADLPNTMAVPEAPPRRPSPYKSIGAPGIIVTGGFIHEGEKDSRLVGQRKFRTYSDLLCNVAIVAAGARAFLFLVAKPEWSVEPADDSAEAQRLADLVDEILHDMVTPFHQVVRRAALFRFYGFGLQEWTAKKRDDGSIGFLDVEPRAQSTIYRWDLDVHGNVVGVVQLAPQSMAEIYLHRQKLVYCVDDSMNDSPEGLGLFRHLAKAADRLARYELLEAWGYQTDIRGIPIVRAPLAELQALRDQGAEGIAAANAQLTPFRNLLSSHNKSDELGILIESETYRSTGEQQTPSSIRRFDFELLKGEAGPHAEIAAAIERLNREMARVLGVEHLLLGADSQGSHAMAQDKSQAFAELIDATIVDLRAQFEKDLLEPLWLLNGWDRDLMPTFRTSPLALTDIEETGKALVALATAGAPLMPNDPAVNKVRQLIGLPDAPEVDLSLTPPMPGVGMLPGQAEPISAEEQAKIDAGAAGQDDEEVTDEPEESGKDPKA